MTTVTDHAKDGPHLHPKQTGAVHHMAVGPGGHRHSCLRFTEAVHHVVRDSDGRNLPCLIGMGIYGTLHPQMNREIGLATPLALPVTPHLTGIGSPVDTILRAQVAHGQTVSRMGHQKRTRKQRGPGNLLPCRQMHRSSMLIDRSVLPS